MSSRKRTRSPVPVAAAMSSSAAAVEAVVDPGSEKKTRCSDSKLVKATTVVTPRAAAAAAVAAAADALYEEAQDCEYSARDDLLRRAAESGHAMACVEYTWRFEVPAQGVPWLRAAIAYARGQSNESLVNNLAYLRLGYLVSLDWWRRGALRGYRDCLTLYGECLYHGKGIRDQVVTQDIPQAVRLYRLAAADGCETAMEHLGTLSSPLSLVCKRCQSKCARLP